MSTDFFADFNVTLPGTRISSNVPELRILSTFNRMELSNNACEIMGLVAEDKVLIIDNPVEQEDENEVYYIIKHPEVGSTISPVGSKLAFSYSGYYSAMILGDAKLHKAGRDDLKAANVLVPDSATTSAIYNVSYLVSETGEDFVYAGVSCPVFKLSNRAQHDVKRRNAVTSDNAADIAENDIADM